MKAFLIGIVLVAVVLSLAVGWLAHDYYDSTASITVTAVFQDERGLTSVTFIQDGKEYAYDYLTKQEYLNFLNTGKP